MTDNLRLAKNLYTVLQDALFFGDRLSSGEFACLMQPGQFISGNLDEGNLEDMAIQADLTNQAYDTSFLYSPITTSTIAQKYDDVLNFASLPDKQLTPAELKEIDRLRKLLADNQSAYDVGRDRYYDAVDAYEFEANKQSPSPSALLRLEQKRDQALNQWEVFGGRSVHENYQGQIIQMTAGNPSRLWNDFRTRFTGQRRTAPKRGPYYQTFFVPHAKSWSSPQTSWGYYSKHVAESHSHSYSHSTSWSAGASGRWGLFSARGGGGGSSSYTHSSSDASDVTISFEYLRVRILRPWLVPDIFGYRFWTWNKTYGPFVYLSDGGNLAVTPPVRPLGIMPVLPTHFVLARNVEITANFSHNDQTFISSQISGSVGGGWGPFSFSGSYSESTSESWVNGSFDGTTIRIAQPQLIAFIGGLLRKTPDPDTQLPFTADAVFPNGMHPSSIQQLADVRSADLARARAESVIAVERQLHKPALDLSLRREDLEREYVRAYAPAAKVNSGGEKEKHESLIARPE